MASNDVPCSFCGTAYSARRLRCPKCHLPREDVAAALTAKDRLAGLVLISLAGLATFAVGWWIYKTGFGRQALAMVIPLWCLLHGILLLMGIHLRDFYAWWNQLAQPVRIAIQVLGVLAFLFLVWFLVVSGRSQSQNPRRVQAGFLPEAAIAPMV